MNEEGSGESYCVYERERETKREMRKRKTERREMWREREREREKRLIGYHCIISTLLLKMNETGGVVNHAVFMKERDSKKRERQERMERECKRKKKSGMLFLYYFNLAIGNKWQRVIVNQLSVYEMMRGRREKKREKSEVREISDRNTEKKARERRERNREGWEREKIDERDRKIESRKRNK